MTSRKFNLRSEIMRKVVLLFAVFIFTGLFANPVYPGHWHRITDPVQVRERGIIFFVFPNGDFDFNAHGTHYQYAGYRGVRVERDRYGKIRRVGNVYINYNRYGQVSRIGHVFIKYNHRGLVSRIGHKFIRYNRRGYYVVKHRTHHTAYVQHTGFNYDFSCDTPAYTDYSYNSDEFDFDENFNDNYENGNDDYYYRPSVNTDNKDLNTTSGRRRR